ncbi:unknown [Bacteroides sp. CAG:714]|nr:unknown [Bacteroides sp. CAG:714]
MFCLKHEDVFLPGTTHWISEINKGKSSNLHEVSYGYTKRILKNIPLSRILHLLPQN